MPSQLCNNYDVVCGEITEKKDSKEMSADAKQTKSIATSVATTEFRESKNRQTPSRSEQTLSKERVTVSPQSSAPLSSSMMHLHLKKSYSFTTPCQEHIIFLVDSLQQKLDRMLRSSITLPP